MIVRRRAEMGLKERANMRDGEGVVTQVEFLQPDELLGRGRMFAEFNLPPGASVGIHQHDGESEFYLILEGEGTYYMDGDEYLVQAGDLTTVPDHHRHGIKNTSEKPLKFIGLILFTEDHQA